jgi:broad specificity phosphatase PhoE
MAEVVLLRHAETEWSIAGKHTGRTDVPLTVHGRELAARLRPRFAGRAFALVLSSPLSRARDTAELAGVQAALDDDLMEWDYGEYEGITTKEIHGFRPDWDLWHDGVPGGEMPADVAARVDRVIARALAADGDVCLVAHGHVLRVLGARWLEQPPAFGARLWLATGAVCTLGWERETRALRGWNLLEGV